MIPQRPNLPQIPSRIIDPLQNLDIVGDRWKYYLMQETGIIHFLETQKDDRSPINLT